MIHARKDYNRFQEPRELLTIINNLLTELTKNGIWEDEEAQKFSQELKVKYETISEGSTAIAEDEPVMVFRAKDFFFLKVIENYQGFIKQANGDLNIIKCIDDFVPKVIKWRSNNQVKLPDTPDSAIEK